MCLKTVLAMVWCHQAWAWPSSIRPLSFCGGGLRHGGFSKHGVRGEDLINLPRLAGLAALSCRWPYQQLCWAPVVVMRVVRDGAG